MLLRLLRRRVGTHGLCVRCVKGYSIMILTGMDALPLDTLVRPYRIQSRLVSSRGRPLHPLAVDYWLGALASVPSPPIAPMSLMIPIVPTPNL